MSHWCLTCKKYPSEEDYESICKEKRHDIDFEDQFEPSRKELGLSTKSKSENKTPDVERVVKGWFGDIFVESIYMNDEPYFLANVNGEIKLSKQFEFEGKIIAPIEREDTPYETYEFSKSYLDLLRNNPPTKEKLLEQLETKIKRYIDVNDNNRLVILIDTFLTYCQDQIDTVHYLFIVGDTESGKSTIGHLIKNVGYRVLYQTDLNYAGIYNFYGTREEANGTIIEDEAQNLDSNKDKIRLYKNSYTRDSKMAIVVGKDTGHKRQIYYNTFGFKVFIGENIPYDKGFRERLVVLRMNTGFPEANIKRLTTEEKEDFILLRNSLLFYKVSHIREQIPIVKTGLTNRDEELFADFIRVSSGTKYEESARETVKQFIKERHESIHNSFESKLFELIVLPIDEKFLIIFEDFWNHLTEKQDTIKGRLDHGTFFSYDYGKITRYRISQTLTDKFQAKKEVIHREKKQVTAYLFNPKILIKLVEKYNISLPIDHVLYQDKPTLRDSNEL
ncbi:hypothetical protein YTPLAS73_04170 [Nitrosarchaeum sp.]|nr:hypothetical protein YTPLAS73_04170 [Nitrosarchaeum sp.]